MKEIYLRGKPLQRALKLIEGREEDAEIGDNSLIVDLYRFKRGRELHVYYSLYNAKNKSAYIKYK